MAVPDVTGRKLEKALVLLEAKGIDKINVTLTASPRMRVAGYDGSARVVRQSIGNDGTVELLVCNMDVNQEKRG